MGRGNTAVNTGGYTVVVEEVERLLGRFPGVEEVAPPATAAPLRGTVG